MFSERVNDIGTLCDDLSVVAGVVASLEHALDRVCHRLDRYSLSMTVSPILMLCIFTVSSTIFSDLPSHILVNMAS